MSHDDRRRHLAGKYKPASRFQSFGPILERIAIMGFRGVASLDLEIRSPVIALSGLNGTGKSTIAQLAACAYRAPANFSRHYVKDYFPVSVVDPQPFADDARVLFEYADRATSRQVTVSRAVKEWSGYKRQPERATYYVGVNHFLPKVEKRDFSVYGGARLVLGGSQPIPDQARLSLQAILGLRYEEADFTDVTLSSRSTSLAMVKRTGQRYSENHMGFGEGRMFYLVDLLESAPEQSLFIIEEPETSLHGDAQARLAQYFVEVADRRRHQLIITTHSSAILRELSRDSVVYLRRESTGAVTATAGLSTYQVDSFLNEHGRNAPSICVEDSFAQGLLTEILRAYDPDLLAGVSFMTVGSAHGMKAAVSLLQRAGLRVVGITDTDMVDDGEDDVLSLPGIEAPEREVFGSLAVEEFFASDPYNLDIRERLASVSYHHHYVQSIATAVSGLEDAIVMEACRAYVAGAPPEHFQDVVDFIKGKLGDRR